MNWNYISGFFDADGSITLAKPNKSKLKTVYLSFHNNELVILEAIRDFIELKTGVKGVIITKAAKSINQATSYDLKYDYFPKVISIVTKLSVHHPKKKHRIDLIKRIYKIIPRNGKYTPELLSERKKLEELFFEH
jgi:hypothetical protein